MDESIVELGRKYGWWIPVLYLAMKYGNVAWRKWTRQYVSYSSLDRKIETIETRLETHLVKEIERDKVLAVLQTNLANSEKRVDEAIMRTDKHIEQIWNAIDDIRNRMIGGNK